MTSGSAEPESPRGDSCSAARAARSMMRVSRMATMVAPAGWDGRLCKHGRAHQSIRQVESPVVAVGVGQGDGGHGPQTRLPAAGRFIAACNVADAVAGPAV